MARPLTRKIVGIGAPLLGCALLAAVLVGCSSAEENFGCPTVDPQGGNPAGSYGLSSSCAATYDRVQSGDWCSQLVLDANGIRMAVLGHGALAAVNSASNISLTADSKYTSQLTFTGSDKVSFSKSCMRAYGQEPTCPALATALDTFLMDSGSALQSYTMIPIAQQFAYPPGTKPLVKYSSFNCQGDPSVSCNCTYNVDLTVPDKGAWITHGSVLTLFSETEALPYVNDYSAPQGSNQLQLVGHEGTDVLGQKGLRTLVFTRQ